MSSKNRKILITVIAFGLGAGLLVWAAADAQWVETVSAQEYIDNSSAYSGKSLKIFGKVLPGSVKDSGHDLSFEMYWGDGEGAGGGVLRVKYVGLHKADLKDDAEILVDCRAEERFVIANKILTKCPSKYKSRQSGEPK